MSAPAAVSHSTPPPLLVAQYVELTSASTGALPSASPAVPPPPAGRGASSSSAPAGAGSRVLESLPEASHVNALAEARGPSPAGLPASLARDVDAALAGLAPAQRAKTHLCSDGYDVLAVPLANERWRERWERLCLAPHPSPANGHMAAAEGTQAAHLANPGAMGGSWELLSRGAGGGMARSSSRPLALAHATGAAASAAAAAASPHNADATQREAEEWRRAPAFRRGEVNISKLGAFADAVRRTASLTQTCLQKRQTGSSPC
jgi:protein arginine N-methyltransferase 5